MRQPISILTAIFLILSSNLFAIEVGSIAESRFSTGYTLDGSEMVPTREKLVNPANFGPGGTVVEGINITDACGTDGSRPHPPGL